MGAALAGRNHIALVFYRAGAQQQFPMGFAGVVGEGGGQHQHLKRALGAEKFGKAQIVAHALRDAPAVCLKMGHFAAGLDGIGFGVVFA